MMRSVSIQDFTLGGFAPKVGCELISLCLCVSVVGFAKKYLTTETQRHREKRALGL